MKRRTKLFLLTILIFVVGYGAYSWGINQVQARKIEELNQQAITLYQSLPLPEHTILLATNHESIQPYNQGCISGQTEIVYGTASLFQEILAHYRQSLPPAGWTLEPGNPVWQDRIESYALNAQTHLLLAEESPRDIGFDFRKDFVPTVVVAHEANYATLYYLSVSITEPSDADCWG